ncbi:hypothetical protein [Microbacterium radiodurans]|uniref:Uncharacterized protein n=1 Tax=Microbacterium radiodurans TaxID=661398 RepID=A0A5J5IR26_9MICO|nr:hypothetical protein [Microbacterium radiodurans]KAA9084148.1 hypothetical protein F6B42_14305 [Microbacterium radiodurans]
MSNDRNQGQASSSLWYFIGATFIFAMPNLMFGDLAWWARLALLVLGLAVMAAGFVQLRREMRAKRGTPAADGGTAPPTGSSGRDER